MLEKAALLGARDALARFGVKTALNFGSIAGGARQMMIGRAPEVFVEGARTFAPGGSLHWRNVMWPTVPGSRAMTWLGRAGTLAMLPMIPSMLKSDPREGHLSNMLGGLGGLAGTMYGGTAGGMVGMPLGAAAGQALGHGIGHLLGSRPKEQEV
jgi:hypothetical protein